jgi:hypothetical protein
LKDIVFSQVYLDAHINWRLCQFSKLTHRGSRQPATIMLTEH